MVFGDAHPVIATGLGVNRLFDHGLIEPFAAHAWVQHVAGQEMGEIHVRLLFRLT